MAYCTQNDILMQLDETTLIELTDDAGAGEIDEDVVTRAIADADEEIEAEIAMRQHKDRVLRLGCIVCRRLYHSYVPAVMHHMRAGMGMAMRNDDYHGFGLCPRHHTDGNIGFAIHKGQKTWENLYGTERELLEYTYELLGEEAPE